MHTKEAPTSSTNENTHSYERSSVSGDSLRSSLLSAGEAKDAVLPENTFAIRCDSHTFSAQTVVELSQWVDEEREYRIQKSTTGHMNPTAWEARSVASLDGEMKFDRMDGKTPSDITILFDKNTRAEAGETHIPSAVIIHRPMSVEEVLRIREALPYGVPIIDGETNELLDDVGRSEREMGREVNAVYHDLGGAAFRASRISEGFYDREFDDIVTHYTDEYRDKPYNYRREAADDVWANPSFFASGTYAPRTESPAGSTGNSKVTVEEPLVFAPESEEVKAHRAKEKIAEAEAEAHVENNVRNINKASDAIFDAAKDLYDVPHLGDLNDNQLRKVERRARRNLHPDKGFDNGGDIGAFKETGAIMEKVRQHNATKAGDTPDGS